MQNKDFPKLGFKWYLKLAERIVLVAWLVAILNAVLLAAITSLIAIIFM